MRFENVMNDCFSRIWGRRNAWLRQGILAVSIAGLAGCGRNSTETYTVPKAQESAPVQQPATAATAGTAHAASMPDQIDWTLPEGWAEKEGSRMGEKNFDVPAGEGQNVEASLIPFPSMVGKEAMVVNIWRQQMELPPLNPDEIENSAETVPVGDLKGQLYDLVKDSATEDSAIPERTLVVMLNEGTSTWFFKLVGDKEPVEAAKPSFFKFLDSITFTKTELPPSHPPIVADDAATPRTGIPGTSAGAGGETPEWNVPEGWQQTAPGSMLLASFEVSDSNGSAKVTVSSFPGSVGGTLANVNRWRGQLGLSSVTEGDLSEAAPEIALDAGTGNLVDISQPEGDGRQRMVAVMLPLGGKTWFYKILGDYQTVTDSREDFIQFVKSARYEGN